MYAARAGLSCCVRVDAAMCCLSLLRVVWIGRVASQLVASGGYVAYKSFELLATPAAMLPNLPYATVTASVGTKKNDDGSIPITVKTTHTALFVGLTTAAHGRFSRNFFLMSASGAFGGQATVDFVPFGELDLETLTSTLRVEHVRSYL